MTNGQNLTATLRSSFRINTRSRDRRDGLSIKADMLEAILNASQYAGYYSEAKTAIYREGFGAALSYGKHVDGYRVDGMVRFQIIAMSPWEFAGMLGDMVDAGVTNVGAGETYFSSMRTAA